MNVLVKNLELSIVQIAKRFEICREQKKILDNRRELWKKLWKRSITVKQLWKKLSGRNFKLSRIGGWFALNFTLNYRKYLNALFFFELSRDFQGTEHSLQMIECLDYRESTVYTHTYETTDSLRSCKFQYL